MLVAQPKTAAAPVAVIPAGEDAEAEAFALIQTLRSAGIRSEIGYRGNLRRRMERANRGGARAAVILGAEEAARGVAQLKDLVSGEQREVAIADLVTALKSLPVEPVT
jgi:histidyl-tRNA synthetase